MAINESQYGLDHPQLFYDYSNLSLFLEKNDSLEASIPIARKGMTIGEQIYKETGRQELGSVYSNFGSKFSDLQMHDSAQHYLLKAKDVLKDFNPKTNEDLLFVYNSLSYDFRVQTDYEKAMEYLDKALEIGEKNYEPENSTFGFLYRNKAKIYYQSGKAGEAKSWIEKSYTILKKSLDGNHPVLVEVSELREKILKNIPYEKK